MKISLGKSRFVAALAALMLWSAGAYADQSSDEQAEPQDETRDQAEHAHRDAADDAIVRIAAATRLDLDVELSLRATPPVSGD